MNNLQVDVSNTLDSVDVTKTKKAIMEYANVITNTSIFNENNNKLDIAKLIYTFLEDLYINEPKETIDFTNQQPSNKFVENLFKQYGISDKILNKYPDELKAKTAYLFEQLYENKGSNKIFDFFNIILKDFYHNLNFYNVQIQQRKIESKYSYPRVVRAFYLNLNGEILPDYNVTIENSQTLIDPNIEFNLYTTINEKNHEITYKIKFYQPLQHDVIFKLDFTNNYSIPRLTETYEIKELKYDIITLTNRSVSDLVYELNPVLINDNLSIIDTIDSTALRTNKFVMQKADFFNRDKFNYLKPVVSPVITNVLFIQFANSNNMDTMSYFPDLVRIFAMTKTQNQKFSFKINNVIIKVHMQELLDILTFIKLHELKQFANYDFDKQQILDSYNLIYPIDKLDDIYKLILYYKDMKHDYASFKEFKQLFNSLIGDPAQKQSTKIFNLKQFSEYLAGNIPSTFSEFFVELDKFYPDNVNFFQSHDQNKIMKQEVNRLYTLLNPVSPDDLLNLISLRDTELNKLNNSVYDMLRSHFIYKYPRVVQAIEALTTRDSFLQLYLNSYKRILVETAKMDNLIIYFINDIFKLFIGSAAFKETFFNPVLDLFERYFFAAELSYQNSDAILYKIKDKMQQVVLGSKHTIDVIDNEYSEININDTQSIMNNYIDSDTTKTNDSWNIQIINDTTGIHNISSTNDSGYKNGQLI